MRKIIQDQLNACIYADLSNYNQQTNTYHIPRYTKPIYTVNNCYLVRLPLSIINNTTSTLAVNWNNGNAPQHEYLKIFVNKFLGKMIYVDGLAFDFMTQQDLNIMWSGWLPIEEITQIAAL